MRPLNGTRKVALMMKWQRLAQSLELRINALTTQPLRPFGYQRSWLILKS